MKMKLFLMSCVLSVGTSFGAGASLLNSDLAGTGGTTLTVVGSLFSGRVICEEGVWYEVHLSREAGAEENISCVKKFSDSIKSLFACYVPLRSVPRSFLECSNLELLDLSNCNMNKLGIDISGLEHLIELNLEQNSLTSLKCRYLPQSLKTLLLAGNQNLKGVPGLLRDLSYLEEVTLEGVDEYSRVTDAGNENGEHFDSIVTYCAENGIRISGPKSATRSVFSTSSKVSDDGRAFEFDEDERRPTLGLLVVGGVVVAGVACVAVLVSRDPKGWKDWAKKLAVRCGSGRLKALLPG